jgi:acylphosphatase
MATDLPPVRVRLVVSGRVQGVFFRDSCRAEARRLGVHGWVRNRPDGTVEVVAEGARGPVGELAAWCHHGPPRAIVTNVAISDEEPAGEGPFTVR